MIKNKELKYMSELEYTIFNSSKQPTRIGLGFLSEFSKFQIN